jgi:molybdate transport system substrate-binding protein
LGLVYASDAVAEPKVKIVGVLPRTSHPLIVYPGAVVQASKAPDQAKAFLAWLKGRRAQAILLKAGFSPLP